MDLSPVKSLIDTLYSWVSFLLFGGLLAYFAFTFRAYYNAVESHQKLSDLMNDPKVRVANGEQASNILEAAQDNKEEDITSHQDLEMKADLNRS